MRAMVTLATGIALFGLAVSVAGQQPRTQNPPASARLWPPAHLPDGQPDVQGLWRPPLNGTLSLTNPMAGEAEFVARITGARVRNPSRIVDPPDGMIPYQPWAAARQAQQASDWDHPTKVEHVDTQNRCLLGGVPRPFYNTRFRILQPDGQVVFVWDDYHSFRVVPLDRRPHLGPNIKLWMGDSRGHWEGNTLVIDVTNLNAKFRLSVVGDFFSDNAHLVERLTFVDANTMNYEVVITDPTVFTRPWTMRVLERGVPDDEMAEFACHEGDRTSDSMLLTDINKK
jgi:hypothetical protein